MALSPLKPTVYLADIGLLKGRVLGCKASTSMMIPITTSNYLADIQSGFLGLLELYFSKHGKRTTQTFTGFLKRINLGQLEQLETVNDSFRT